MVRLRQFYYVECMQLIAEFMGMYLLLFAGFAAGAVNKDMEEVLTFPGIGIFGDWM